MTKKQIIAQRKKIEVEIERHEALIRLEHASLFNLQKQCSHPKKWSKTCYDGSTSTWCDDCGWYEG